MAQQRLNNLMVLHVHRDRTDALNLIDIANDYVEDSEQRLHVFGKFKCKKTFFVHTDVVKFCHNLT